MATLIETLSNPATFTYEVSAQRNGAEVFRRRFVSAGAAISGAIALPGASFTDRDNAPDAIASDAVANDSVGISLHYVDDYQAPVTYSISSQSTAGAFTVQASTGLVAVGNPALLDSSARPTETLTVRSTLTGTATYIEETYTVTVTA